MNHCGITNGSWSVQNSLQELFSFVHIACIHTPSLSFNSTHGNLTDLEQVTVVGNSVHSHDGSIGDRTTDSVTA